MKSLKKGFTLVELIIVITILAILAITAFLSYGSYTADARNTKRTNDVNLIGKKYALLEAEGRLPADVFDMLTGSSDITGLNNPAGYTLTAKKGKLNEANFKESLANFKDPESKEDYKIVIVKGTPTDTTKNGFSCIEAIAKRENAAVSNPTVFYSSCAAFGVTTNETSNATL